MSRTSPTKRSRIRHIKQTKPRWLASPSCAREQYKQNVLREERRERTPRCPRETLMKPYRFQVKLPTCFAVQQQSSTSPRAVTTASSKSPAPSPTSLTATTSNRHTSSKPCSIG